MKSDWETFTLDDVCLKITDGAHNSPKSVDVGKPMASVKDLTTFGVDLSNARLIDAEEYEKLVKQGCQPQVNDVLIAKDGNSALDTVCVVREPLDAVMLSSVAILRPDDNKLDPFYLKYYFSSKSIISYLKRNFISGAAIPRVVLRDFKKAEISLPPLNKQKAISEVLRSLDDKIELNRKMNQTLEEMAQALFKSWFVGFDPVHAKAGCKTNKELEVAAEELGISKEVLELFPSEFVESEMGMIPLGWSHDSLCEHISVTKGKSYKSSELEESTTALVTLKSFLRGGGYRTDGIKPYTGKYKDEQVVQPGELIMAYTDVTQAADVIGKPAIVLKDETIDTLVASLDVGIVRVTSQAVNLMYLYQLFKTRRFQGYILGHTSGTTVLHLAKGWFDSYEILLPEKEIMDTFNKVVEPLFKQMQLNVEQERSLQKTRDILLPKLLSGELDVSTIDLDMV